MKDDIHNKLVIISVLILIPVGILYLNMGDKLFDTRENLANNQGDSSSAVKTPANGVSSPDGSNFVNICHPKKSNLYNINLEALDEVATKTGISANSCKYDCDTGNCDLYLMNNDVCKLYKKKAHADSDAIFFGVNCNNKVLPSSDSSNPDAQKYIWAGEGKIESSFYQAHKKNFKHINYLLDTANDIKGDYIEINSEIANLKDSPVSVSEDRDKLRGLYNTVNSKLEKVADYLDLDKNTVYSDFVKNKYSAGQDKKTNLGGKEFSHFEMLEELKKQKDDTVTIEAREINDKVVDDRTYIIYLMLFVLMILSVFILVIFKMAPSLISDNVVITYFTGVLFLLFFPFFILKFREIFNNF